MARRPHGWCPTTATASASFVSLLLVCCLVTAAAGPALAATPEATGGPAEIVAVYPDTLRGGDAGEYVVVSLPEPGNWSLSDGETTVALRNRTGRVVVGADPAVLREWAPDATVVAAPLALANGGETVTLSRGGERVHHVQYEGTTEGSRYLPLHDEWRPRGFTPRDPAPTGPANATTFLLPDSPDLPLETLRSAAERILLAGYTFSSTDAANALVAAAERGVHVRVLVDADPVGEISRRQATLLDRLTAAGVEVRVVGVAGGRYAFHHPKYAVVDDRALVLTENWKPAGVGGHSSRGWGVRVESAETAAELAAVFRHDAGGPDTRNWSAFRRGKTFERIPPSRGAYPSVQPPERVHARNVTVLTAPGNAEQAIVGYLDGAEERVDVIQPSLGREDNALVRATLRAAGRGVEVRILLSGAWYVAEENAALVSWLRGWAERNDAPLSVTLAEPGGRYEKIHAKGVLVDDDLAVVGSLNWNRHSARENREVALALHGPEPVRYYRRAFERDWEGGGGGRTWLYAGGAAATVLVAGMVGKRTLSFAAVVE